MVEIKKDTPLIEEIYNYDVILVGMSVDNSMYRGFQYDVHVNFPTIRDQVNKSPFCDKRKFGKTFETSEQNIIFVMCYIFNPLNKKNKNDICVNYDNIKSALIEVKEKYKGHKIASPVIGGSRYDGNGDRNKIIGIFNEVFSDVDITLYDYDQKDFLTEIYFLNQQTVKKRLNREISKEEYNRIRTENLWKSKHGIYQPMPKDFKRVWNHDRGRYVKASDLKK